MSDATYPNDAWVRLGHKARQRRIALGLSQPEVNAAGGPSTGVISKIENAKQTSYEERVLVQLERALQWRPGSATAVLEGGEPADATSEGTRPALPSGAAGKVVADARADLDNYVPQSSMELVFKQFLQAQAAEREELQRTLREIDEKLNRLTGNSGHDDGEARTA